MINNNRKVYELEIEVKKLKEENDKLKEENEEFLKIRLDTREARRIERVETEKIRIKQMKEENKKRNKYLLNSKSKKSIEIDFTLTIKKKDK